MLHSDTDSAVVSRWLRDAMARRKSTMAALAEACGVRPQAVYGWLKTGRITKRNLATAAAFLQVPPPFAEPERPAAQFSVVSAEEPEAAYGWPFPMLDQAAVLRCTRADLNRLEGALIATAHTLGLDIVRRVAA